MPRYEVQLGRTLSIYERAYITVEADDEYHAKALALDTDPDMLDWIAGLSFDGGEIEAEDAMEVKDDQA